MRLNRTQNAKRNIVFGFINKIVALLFPFLLRMVIIRQMGADYLGLGSLFSSILSVLNLTELGFSSAIIYSMYKPIAEDDNETLCAILQFYRKVYIVVGIIIAVAGVAVLPFLSFFIHGTIPSDIDIYLLYALYLASSVFSYLFFAYKNALIAAYQRADVISNIHTIVHLFTYGMQLVVIIATKNYYLYAVLLIIAAIAQNLVTEVASRKMFPSIVCRGRLHPAIKEDIKTKVKGLLVNKVCQTSRNSFDSIFVSSFLGLTQTAIYNNYYYIMNAVIALIGVIAPSILAGVGNSITTESHQKNYADMQQVNFVYMWLSSWCTVCLLCLYQPFTKLVFGETMLFPFGVVILFCAYFYVLKMGDIRSVYSEAKGLWWENRHRAIVEAMLNLVLNLVLGKLFGIYGIVAATLISLFCINFVWGSTIIFKHYFTEMGSREFYLLHLIYATVTIIACAATYFVCSLVMLFGVAELVVRFGICVVLPNILFFCAYSRLSIFRKSFVWVENRLLGNNKLSLRCGKRW